MTRRLVSFLGLGPAKSEWPHYTPVRYFWGDEATACEPTPLVCRAIVDLLGDVDEVVLLGTAEVRERWLGADSARLEGLLGRGFDFVEVPGGRDEGELREIFVAVLGALGVPGVEGALPGVDSVLVDVTHGFRIQPMLGTSAVTFALSEWQRLGRDIPELRVLYGAFEARDRDDERPRPLWDLTEIVTVARYNAALDALVRYGRADDLAALTRKEARRAREEARERGEEDRALGRHSHLERLGKAARWFADDLALGRVRDLFTKSAPWLRDRLGDDATREWVRRLPVLEGALESLGRSVAGLCAEDVLGRSGAAAMAHLARHYGETQRFAEQAAALREGLVTEFALRTESQPCPEPGKPGCREARERTGEELGRLQGSLRGGGGDAEVQAHRELVELFASVGRDRNDIEHLGLNREPRGGAKLRRALAEYTERFGALVAGIDAPAAEARSPAGGVFVNLSNHPVASWPDAQRDAVAEMGFAGPVDLPGGMPAVDPEADGRAVLELALDLSERALEAGAAAALVATDFALAHAIVTELRSRGVRCFATTAARSTSEARLPDGTLERRTRYAFVRLREYVS